MKRILIVALALIGWAICAPAQAEPKASIYPQLAHSGEVIDIAFSHDGSLLASGSSDHTVKLWDVASGRELRTLPFPMKDEVNVVAFSPDGVLVAAAGNVQNQLIVWDVRDGNALYTIRLNFPVYGLAFSPDGTMLAIANLNGLVVIVDPKTGRDLHRLPPASQKEPSSPPPSSQSIAFSRDSRFLAYPNANNTVTLWDLASGKEVRTWTAGATATNCVEFSPDGTVLATSSTDGFVKLWGVPVAAELNVVRVPESPVRAIDFSPGGGLLAIGTTESITLWDLTIGKKVNTAQRLTGGSTFSLRFSPNGRQLASAPAFLIGLITLWDVESGRPLRSLTDAGTGTITTRAVAATVSGSDGTLASANGDGTIRLWDPTTGRQTELLQQAARLEGVMSIAVSPKGDTLASVSNSDLATVKLWNLKTRMARSRTAPALGAPLHRTAAFSPDGTMLAAAGSDGSATVWEVSDAQELHTFKSADLICLGTDPCHPPMPSPLGSENYDKLSGLCTGACLAFVPGSNALAIATNYVVKLYDVKTGRELHRFPANMDQWSFEAIAISSDGRTLATATAPDGTMLTSENGRNMVILWDLGGEQPPRMLDAVGPPTLIQSVAFSPDGKWVATANEDGTIGLWDISMGREVQTLTGHLESVNSVSFSADGKTLTSASDDGTVRIWNTSSGAERAELVGFKDGSWISVTPEGFFNSSSEAAEENLNVRIGRRVFGISSFRDDFYRPNLVKNALGGESIAKYGDIADVKLPPEVDFADLPAITSDPKLELTVRLSGGDGEPGPVRIFSQGTVIQQDDSGTAGGLMRTYTVPLVSGKNDLKVAAANSAGDVWFNASTSITASLPANDNAPHKLRMLHAIVVGVNDFKDPNARLTQSVADAQLFADTLTKYSSPLFSAQPDIKVLVTHDGTDQGRQAATRDSLLAAFKAMKPNIGPDDAFVFFVSSHGDVDPRDGEYYIITSNVAGLADEEKGALSRKELINQLANIATTHKLAFIDACKSGALGDTAVLASQALDPGDAAVIISHQVGLTLMLASAKSQLANEGEQGNSVFTYVLAHGLSGAKDLTGDAADPASGEVTSDRLSAYVEANVPPLALKLSPPENQQPATILAGQAFPITKVTVPLH